MHYRIKNARHGRRSCYNSLNRGKSRAKLLEFFLELSFFLLSYEGGCVSHVVDSDVFPWHDIRPLYLYVGLG